jgi:hypothetical protein
MKSSLLLTFVFVLLFSACNRQVCRDCEAFSYDTEAFDPATDGRDLRFRGPDGEVVVFELSGSRTSPESNVCSVSVDEPREIDCQASALFQYTSQELGIDMSFSYEQYQSFRSASDEQVILYFAFRESGLPDLYQTHALIIEPNILIDDEAVILRDSVQLDSTIYTDVLELKQSVEAFLSVPLLPNAGRFVSILLKEGVGILRLTDVDGNVYVRID